MKITLICIGKIKEDFYKKAIAEYLKRLSAYAKVEIIELPDEKIPDRPSDSETNLVLTKEGSQVIKSIPQNSYKIALAINGSHLSSEDLSSHIKTCTVNGISNFTFIIGGSLGLSPTVLALCDYRLSFSKMTFPHQLMRVIFLEQIYRVFKINAGEPYHK